MKKLFLTAILTAALTATAMANTRPVHQLFPVSQSDGTTVMLYKAGDRFYSYYTTPEGHAVVRDAEGTLRYAQLSGGQLTATAIAVHDAAQRTAEEQAFLATNTLTAHDAALAAHQQSRKNAPMRAGTTSTSDGLGKYGTSASGSVPSIGEVTIPVIMVQFKDTKFQTETTQDKLQRFFNEEGYHEDNSYERGSVKDYFTAQSHGLFTPTFDVVALVTLDQNYSYYGSNGTYGSGNDTRALQMVKDAVAAAVSQGVDFSKYLSTKTSTVPNVTIYFAGPGEATGGDENTIWPHEMDLPSIYYQLMSGTRFGSYFVGNEIYGDATSTRLMGMGVFCHEFSHALGLPDFYDPTYSYSGDNPFGMWSVMDNGAYANSTYAPVGYNAYERSFMGWLNVRELSTPETVTLADPNQPQGESAVMLRNPSNQNEYFILENRQPGTWYNSSYGTGLLVTRFNYSADAWTRNTINTTQSLKRACVVTANGSTIADGTALPAHLYGNGTPNKPTHALYDGTTLSDHAIYKVMKQPDGTVVFGYRTQPTIQPIADGQTYERVADLSQLAAKDTVIIVCEQEGMALSTNTQNSGIGAVLVKISDGKAVTNSSVQTLAVGYTASSNTYNFYDRSTRSYLRVANDGTLEMARMTSANNTARATVTIDAGNATIAFAGSKATNNQLSFDADALQFSALTTPTAKVQIYKKTTDTNGIADINAQPANKKTTRTGVYTLSGQYAGQTTDGLTRGIYIKDGRKIVVK